MRILLTVASISLSATLFTMPLAASAHEGHTHAGHGDTQMEKLHTMMPMFSIATAELETTIKKGDKNGAMAQTDRILAAVPDLKQSKPHKNLKQRKQFVALATKLEQAVSLTADQIRKGDFAGATTSIKKIEEVCAACHARFRD